MNKTHLTDTVSVNKKHLTDTVSVNKMHLTDTVSFFSKKGERGRDREGRGSLPLCVRYIFELFYAFCMHIYLKSLWPGVNFFKLSQFGVYL